MLHRPNPNHYIMACQFLGRMLTNQQLPMLIDSASKVPGGWSSKQILIATGLYFPHACPSCLLGVATRNCILQGYQGDHHVLNNVYNHFRHQEVLFNCHAVCHCLELTHFLRCGMQKFTPQRDRERLLQWHCLSSCLKHSPSFSWLALSEKVWQILHGHDPNHNALPQKYISSHFLPSSSSLVSKNPIKML